MNNKLFVLLYSKYSRASDFLIDKIKKSGVDFRKYLSFQSICIDNKDVRNKILKNKQLEVTTVPCLLIILEDGGVQKYDGVKVFQWFDDIIEQIRQIPKKYHSSIPDQKEKNTNDDTVSFQKEKNTNNDTVNFQKEKNTNDDELLENKRIYEQKYKESFHFPTTKNEKNSTTNIDDLLDDNEDNKKLQETQNDKLVKITTNDYKSQKSNNIITKAKELEKGREEFTPLKV